MKTINFYKGTELKYSVYSNSLEDVKNNPLNYFPEYTDDMFITDKNFQYPIIKNNELMEMTREERIEQGIETQLEPGEFIKNKKLVKVLQPSKYHFWNKELNKWDLDLEGLKHITRRKFRQVLLDKIYADFDYNGKIFQMGEADEINFLRVKSAIDIATTSNDPKAIIEAVKFLKVEVPEEFEEKIKEIIKDKTTLSEVIQNLKINWRLKDNSVDSFTFEEINHIYLLWILRGTAVQEEYTAIATKIMEAKSLEELESIEWK
ncbi:hypothetical protein [Fusobacterium polymorphum]|uniref:hypothetical protein n=1 Tax=Fusobacterium nucleatum subsp. polymorphum TaxID=76857 RepID=UPI0030D4E151